MTCFGIGEKALIEISEHAFEFWSSPLELTKWHDQQEHGNLADDLPSPAPHSLV